MCHITECTSQDDGLGTIDPLRVQEVNLQTGAWHVAREFWLARMAGRRLLSCTTSIVVVQESGVSET